MLEVTAKQVQDLRKMSGAGMMDCKNALSASAGDLDDAFKWLREKGIAKAEKKYAAESMFKSAKSRDDAKVAPGKARSFKQAFDAATKAGKDRFMLKGKSYLTTKGKRADRFNPTKIKGADKKESTLGKFKSSKTLKEFFGKIKKKK